MLKVSTFAALMLAAATVHGLAADPAPTFSGQLPTIKVKNVTPTKIGAKLTAEIDNPNPYPLAFVDADCMGTLAEKKYVYGPERAFVVEVAANGKATAEFDMTIRNVMDVLRADDSITEFPKPGEITCQVSAFKSPIGVEPKFAYSIPALTPPAD